MSREPSRPVDYVRQYRVDYSVSRMPPPPGRQAILLGALVIGGLLLSMQLWLLTVALELYLGGNRGGGIWVLVGLSGLVFFGGAMVLRLLSRRARVQ